MKLMAIEITSSTFHSLTRSGCLAIIRQEHGLQSFFLRDVPLSPCRLQGCITGTGKLVEEGEKTSSLIPVYSIVLVGGAVHQQRDMATWLLLLLVVLKSRSLWGENSPLGPFWRSVVGEF